MSLSCISLCSIYFSPKDWSHRYEETYFTANIINYNKINNIFKIEIKSGKLNQWTLEKSYQDILILCNQIKAEFKENIFPSIPTIEECNNNIELFKSWFINILEHKGVAQLKCVRNLLDLDRKLELEITEESNIDDDNNSNINNYNEPNPEIFNPEE